MRLSKKRWGFLCCLGLLLGSAANAAVPDAHPKAARSYLLMRDGEVIAARAPDARRPMASLTKMMTALLLLESGLDLRRVTTVSRAAARETGSRLRLRAGEQMSLDSLLAATVIASSNDACHVIADAVAGSERQFVQRMNLRAAELQLTHTRFTNACGHDAPKHLSSARDMAALALLVMQQPRYAELAAVQAMTVRSLGKRGRGFKLKASNALLGRLPGAVGIKTGTTPGAGECLVALASREHDGQLRWALLVMLDAPQRWIHAHQILDEALNGS